MITSAIVFALLLGAFIFIVLPRGWGWRRPTCVAGFLVLLALIYGGAAESMGVPKPVRLEWRSVQEAKVLAAVFREGEGIYVWLRVPGIDEPRAYVLEWSLETASQLQRATGDAETARTGVTMRAPFEMDNSGDLREPKFYADPQKAHPEKDYGPAVGPVSP